MLVLDFSISLVINVINYFQEGVARGWEVGTGTKQAAILFLSKNVLVAWYLLLGSLICFPYLVSFPFGTAVRDKKKKQQ